MADSPVIEAFREAQAVYEDAIGDTCEATIGATTGIKAIIEEITADEIIVAGGKSDKGAAKIRVAVVDCPGGTKPDKYTTASIRDVSGYILGPVNDFQGSGVLILYIGQPAAHGQGEHSYI